MNIGYAQKPEGPFTRGALVTGSGAGTVAIVKLDGRPISIQPDGSVQDRDPGAIGSWESGRRNGSIVAYSDSAYHDHRVYLLYIVETV